MKTSRHLLPCALFAILFFQLMMVTAQVPQSIPYQAAARDNSCNAISNQNISLRFTIHDATANGTIVYKETQSATSTSLGLFTVNIGQGTPVTGSFSAINWGTNAKFLQVEMDVTGGTNYVDMGTTQMLSVPYALYAANSANLPNGNINGNTLRWNGNAWMIDSTLTNKQSNIGIGTTAPNASAILDLSSTSKGFIMPKMTTAQRDAIVSPVVGLQVFNTDDQCVDIYDGAHWIETCGLKVTGTGATLAGTDAWTQKANFGGSPRYWAAGFSIGSKGYIGTGNDGNSKNDFWEYDPVAGTWTQKANFGGVPRFWASGFAIGSKGYIGLGYNGIEQKDFWEYDPSANTWTQRAYFPGTQRLDAVGFSIGSKGYVGLGYNGGNLNDFWEYNPSADTWTQKANFGGTGRRGATGFSIGMKGYVGTGNDGNNKNDFWEYDPSANTWTQKANFGGVPRFSAVSFSIGSKGYIGTGTDFGPKNDFWEYDPSSNTWTQRANFSTLRYDAVGFSIGSKGYIGTGIDPTGNKNDFYEYSTAVLGNTYSTLNPSTATTVTDNAWTSTVNTNNIFNSNSGNVGIGISSPASILHTVASGAKTTNYSGNLLTSTATSSASGITKSAVEIQSAGSWNGSSSKNIGLYVSSVTGGTNNYDAIFNGGGNVGIGTTSPTSLLQTVASGIKTGNYSGNLFTNAAISSTSGISKSAVEIQSTGAWNGTSANNIGLYVSSVTGGTNNYDAIFNGGGNVGIGNTAPSQKLDVSGTTKTINLQVTNGAFNGFILKSDANGNGTWVSPSSLEVDPQVSSSTNNIVPKWNGSTLTDGSMFDNNGNVGIGISIPTAILHTVASGSKTANYSGNLFTNTATSSTSSVTKTGVEIQSTGIWNGVSSNNIGLYVSSVTGGTNNYDAIFNGGGNVGIGNTAPSQKLDVSGTTKTTNLLTSTIQINNGASNGFVLQSDASGNGSWVNPASIITETDPQVSSSTNDVIPKWNGSTLTDGSIFDNNGNVGIGNNAPSQKLDVSGTTKTINLQVTNGASNGFILQSDANGNGSWVNVASVVTETDPQVSSSSNNVVPKWNGSTLTDGSISDNNGNVGIGISIPTAILHTVASGSKTANYSGNLFTNTATSATSSVTKSGVEIQSAGTWNGASAKNIGLYVSSVSGGTNNYDAIFNGGGNVGIGTASPASILQTVASGAKTTNYSGNLLTSTATSSTSSITKSGVEIQSTGSWSGTSAKNIGLYVSSVTGGTNNYDAIFNGGGNVGIGNTAPSSKLDVTAVSNTPAIGFSGTGAIWDHMYMFHDGSTAYLRAGGAETGGLALQVSGSNIGGYNGQTYTEVMNLLANGNVGIGCTAPTYKLQVVGDIAAQGGTLRAASAVVSTTITACSDIRFKKNITPLQNSLDNVLKLQGVNYYWKTNEFPDRYFNDQKQIGLIAQEVEKIYPELVLTDKDGYKSVDYSKLTPILVEAIKAQQQEIDALKSVNEKQQVENENSKAENQKLAASLASLIAVLEKQGVIPETTASSLQNK